ncbi:diaminopimelate decarboxylase [Saccharothrix ecbatanensis]|uniref:Diaminopimelate decarboxylase n=1 Tax=Saccharothrix ecbatanensis TaxID=1105145 RepID=A0A7W9LY58_9PSEU|nr:type III PLP-dependent enzyme [Saccharothrix ecbatanensis]MBB5800277.1 diaminopimelate decarboxylase [Saccharothrix ecbatanensis]
MVDDNYRASLEARERETLAALRERYGSPIYVYRLDRVRRAAADLKASLPDDALIYYSLKANPEVPIAAELAGAGFSAEVSSAGELTAALAAGYRADQCLYTGPGKTAEEIDNALLAGIRLFSVESVGDYRRVARTAAAHAVQSRCLVRVNPERGAAGTGLRMSGKPSQFGIELGNLDELMAVRQDSLDIVGTHVFLGTNVRTEEELIAEFAVGVEVTAVVRRRLGIVGGQANLGGGFAAPFAEPGTRPRYSALRAAVSDMLHTGLPGWREGAPRIAFESGRALVGDCGTLVCTVTDVKTSRSTTQVVLDAGTNALGGMSGLGRLMPTGVRAVPLDLELVGAPREAALVGPLCTPLDVLARSRITMVPDVDSALAVPNVGAYGLHASLLAFLSRPMPGIVVLDGDHVVSAERLEFGRGPLAEREGVR